MLQMTKIKLELISDPDMFIYFFKKGKKDQIFYISNRYSKANNKYLKSYDPKQETKHIIYLAANNFYGYAMSKFLPTGGFKWINPEEFNLNKYASNTYLKFVLEIDLECPQELHELQNDYLLAPDKIEMKREMLADYQLKIADLYNIYIGKKLVLNLFDKEKYVFHYENLQLYLRLGLKPKKEIHHVLEFNQSQWLKP